VPPPTRGGRARRDGLCRASRRRAGTSRPTRRRYRRDDAALKVPARLERGLSEGMRDGQADRLPRSARTPSRSRPAPSSTVAVGSGTAVEEGGRL